MNIIWSLWTTVLAVALIVSVDADLSQLTGAQSCYDGALESSSTPGLMGGFSPIADPSNDDIVTSIVQLAMTRLNNIADNYQLDTSANDGLTAFQQVATILIVACLSKHKLTYRKRKCYVSLIL